MKTQIIAIFCVLLTIMLAGSAFANLSVTEFTLGDDNTKRHNPLGDDADDMRGDVETKQFTVRNTGTINITGVRFNFGSMRSAYNLSFSEENFNLNAGVSKTITVRGVIPRNLGAITSVTNSKETNQRINIGNFTVSGIRNSTTVSASAIMYAQAENGLDVNDLNIIINGVSYDLDDDEAEEIPPRSTVSIEFEIENNFNDDSNLDIEGDIDLDSDNRDVEFDDRSERLDVRTDNKERFKFDLDIDWRDVEDGDDARLEIKVEGDDDNRAKHRIDMVLDIEFKYPRAEVEVNNFRLSSRNVCPGDIVEYSYEIENTGTRNQKNLRTTLKSNLLNLDIISGRFEVDGRDKSDTESRSFKEAFEIPKNANTRTYDLTFELFYEDGDGDDSTKFQTFKLNVEDCSKNTKSTTTSSGTNSNNNDNSNSGSNDGFVVTPEKTNSGNNNNNPTPKKVTPSITSGNSESKNTGSAIVTAEPKDDGNPLQIIGIIVLVIILLAVIVSLFIVLLKK